MKAAEAELEAGTSIDLVRMEMIKESPTNPRKDFPRVELEELAHSIKTHGVLAPVMVRPKGATYELVFGHRRLRAAAIAGLVDIPAMIRDMTDLQVLEAQLVENCQRADLHALEEAHGYQQLMQKAKYEAADIAARVGRSVNYVYDRLKLLSLTKEAQELFRAGEITTGHAVILARLSPADQARVIGKTDKYGFGDSALFTDEQLLIRDDDADLAEPPAEPRKAISVRELQAWVDAHVKLEAAQLDPMLFPQTFETIAQAKEQRDRVVRITYEEMTPEDAKDGPRPILGRSWRRADGERGSKTCATAVLGQVVIGPGRGEAFLVCIDKKGCPVHWAEEQKQARQREKEVVKTGSTGEDRERLRREKEVAAEAKRKAEAERWKVGLGEVLKALAVAVKKAGTGVAAPNGKAVLQGRERWIATAVKYLGQPKTADDLVRCLAFSDVAEGIEHDYNREWACGKVKKFFGVDAVRIVNGTAPVTKPAAAPRKKPTAAKRKK
jgi:ParB/RepB/Spo0J family partition protein